MNIANTLTISRMACVPLLGATAWLARHDLFFVVATYCMLSDILDGRIARWRGEQSEYGARLDSWADLMMVIGGPFCAWFLQPQLFASEWPFVTAVVGGNLAAVGLGVAKYGRVTSYHTTAARLMAYIAGAGAIIAITWGFPWIFRAGAIVAVYSVVEEMLMTLALPAWTADVRSLSSARALTRPRS